ncbi:MAG: GMC family oxidoreductase [Betaproteobacteria bacterium]
MDSDEFPVYDHIVVGAGTAGCLLANRLSADPDRRVLLIEAGGQDDYVWIHIPVGYLYCIGNPRTDWLYYTEPDPGLNGRRLRYPRGKVLGGSSSINGMIYMRGQSRDYDAWAESTGDPAWGWAQCLPVFKSHEDHWRGASELHGSGGEWRIERPRVRWDILDAFSQAAQEAGIPATEDFNTGHNEGVGYFEVNQRSGLRWNASKAFLRPVISRPNLQVWTGAQVQRLTLGRASDGQLQCEGVELLPTNGAPRGARARRGVVMAAGALGTPQILQLSGVGPGALLHTHGIALLHERPGVGQNLQDHPQLRAVAGVEGVKTLNTMAASAFGKALIGLEYLLKRTGPMSMSPSQLGAFARSSPERAWANVQYHVQPLSLPAFGEPLDSFNAFTASVCNLNPTARGQVSIASADPRAAPLIEPRYLSTLEDRLVAAQSLRLTRRIVAQPALARYRPQELKPGAQFESDEDLARLAGDIGTTIFHPVGTCRMGRADDPLAVVDPRLAVRGVRGLHVADASVMPTITSGNTNSPTLMIAERAAGWILAST